MSSLTLDRAWPTVVPHLALAVIVLTGLAPAALMLLSLAIPLALVLGLASLNSLFSMALPGPGRSRHDLASRLLGAVAYALLIASVFLAIDADPSPSAWIGVAIALVLVFAGMWHTANRYGSLFPDGYTPAVLEFVALAAGIATYVWVAQWRDVLPALVALALRAAFELGWQRRRTDPVIDRLSTSSG